MSGVAGGNRIKKEFVANTFSSFIENVLNKIPTFKKASLSGSIFVGIKPDYGDIDLVALFKGDDKKEIKQQIISTVSALPDNIIIPFKSEKYKGRKFYNSGEIISILYPIIGDKGKTIQVDIIISLSEQEHNFKNEFLNLPAEKQGLFIGLVKTILQEEPHESVFKKLNITNIPGLANGEIYEFNLSSVKLTLRKLKLDENFKEEYREDIWDSSNWDDVTRLLEDFDLEGSFEELLSDIKNKYKNERSRKRVAGIFRSMVSVKSGEVGTQKGKNKERALNLVNQTLNESVENPITVAIYAGGFKPPHKAHFENAKFLSNLADKLIIFIGPVQREGLKITPEQSKQIWEIYAKYLSTPVEIFISKITPIKDTYDWVDANQDKVDKIITGTMESEMKKFAYFIKNQEKYPKVQIEILPVIGETEDNKLSASNIRQSEENIKEGSWIPEEVRSNQEDFNSIINILTAKMESFSSFFRSRYSC